MLIEFRVKNYRSFRDEQVLSLVANSDKSLSSNLAEVGDLRLIKGAAIFGPNASGKSNLIRAIDFMRDMVLLSAESRPDQEIDIDPFILEEDSRNEPSTFEVTFMKKGVRYQYGFSATKKHINEEWLLAYPKGLPQTWFERPDPTNIGNEEGWRFSSHLKGEKRKLTRITRDNVLFISVAAKWKNQQLKEVYDWFGDNLRIIPAGALIKNITSEMILSPEKYGMDKEHVKDFAISFLRRADLGISDLEVRRLDLESIRLPDDMPDDVKQRLTENFEKDPELHLFVEFYHKVHNGSGSMIFPLEDESDGTNRFYRLIGPWLQAMSKGITVFFDELESSLHPLLAEAIVETIQKSSEKNKFAQLIFTTHNTVLLDKKIFRRDQIWFTEKKVDGSTRLFPLSDYKPRKEEAIQRGYLSGRYGAIPIIDGFILND